MAKVLFINPVIREEDVPRHIPYGISLLAAIAVNKGHQVQIYDANAWRLGDDVLADVIRADQWDVIATGSLTTAYNYIKKIVRLAKSVSPKSLVILGGGVVTSMPLDIMKWLPEVDLGIIGEAFVTFPEVLEKIDNKDLDFSQTLGVCYRTGGGEPELTMVRPTIPDLDVLPYPAWDLLPLDIYFKNSQSLFSEEAFLSKRRIDINGSLGCSLVCRYCWHLGTTGDMIVDKNAVGRNDVKFSYGRTIRYHSPRYIVAMVKTLVEKYQVDFISFLDENLMTMDAASGRTWLRDLSNLWIAEGLQPTCRRDRTPVETNQGGVFWGGTSHAGLYRTETLKQMYESGCSHLVYGIESFDPTILKNLGKGSSREANLKAPKETMDIGIKPIPNIIIGFPEETFESIRNTIDGMIQLGLYAKPHFATAYPGSEWFYTYRESIMGQYHGSLEAFIEDLGDASKPTATISRNFTAVELIGLQNIVMTRNLRLLDLFEKHWIATRKTDVDVVSMQKSWNFERKRISAPIMKSNPNFGC